MISRKWLLAAVTSVCLCATTHLSYGAVEIEFWHAMNGVLNESLNSITEKFNNQQDQYHVTLVNKGEYSEAMTAAIAAVRAKAQPDIIQVLEVGTATFMAAKNVVYPVEQLMADEGVAFNHDDYLPAVVRYYSDENDQLLSQPFNVSSVVIYYNLDAFEKAGLDTKNLPKTWDEVSQAARLLVDKNITECGFTTAWPAWINVENISAWHNVPLSTAENGFKGLDAKFTFNNKLMRQHWQNLVDWKKEGIFTYGGRNSAALNSFRTGKCPIIVSSSASVGDFRASANFKFTTALMPFYPNIIARPQSTMVGGASLWVMRGKPKAHYKGIALYLNYLSSPQAQAEWSQTTGYLPITEAALKKNKQDGYYEAFPDAYVPVKSITLNPPTPNSRGTRYGNYTQIRTIFDEEFEQALSGVKTVPAALSDAQSRSDAQLREFERHFQR